MINHEVSEFVFEMSCTDSSGKRQTGQFKTGVDMHDWWQRIAPKPKKPKLTDEQKAKKKEEKKKLQAKKDARPLLVKKNFATFGDTPDGV